jgi:gas vesicle protein
MLGDDPTGAHFSMDLTELSHKLTKQIDDLRDRTAEAVGADGGSLFRELSKLSDQLDEVESHLDDRIDEVATLVDDHWTALRSSQRRTTWPRRAFWLALGVAGGMAAAYLADPDRGRTRRAEISQQLSATAREVAEQAAGQAKELADRAKGELIESASDAVPDEFQIPADAQTLRDRIQSEAFGGRDDVQDVIIKVDGPGMVALKGTVPTPDNERDLLAAVSNVAGVLEVRSELNVRGV